MAQPETSDQSIIKTLLKVMMTGSFVIIVFINLAVIYVILQHSLKSTDYLLISANVLTIIYILMYFYILKYVKAQTIQIENENILLDTYLNGVINNSPELILILDLHHRYVIFNSAYQSKFITAFGKSIAINMNLEDALIDIPTEYKNKIVTNWKRALSGEKFSENILIGKDTYEVSYSPIKNVNNHIIAAIEISRNITHILQQEHASRELNEKLAYEMQELGIQNEKMTLLIELTDIVQACASINEATKPIAMKCRKILHFADGTLYISNTAENQLEEIVTWGEPVKHSSIITPDQCWALRKGHTYIIKNAHANLICEHISEDQAVPYMCIPLMAQNALIGLLHLDFASENQALSDENRLLISAVTETLALAFANIKLRETLRIQSLHDSLTGLYNRRFFNEFILKAISTAYRNQSHLAVVMIDIDFFKQFNDNYGHDVGDMVLEELGKLLQNEIRSNDLACRYGGEEFLCVLSDCTLDDAIKWSEKLRSKISNISIRFASHKIENITLSIGISIYPDDGLTAPILVESADQALYHAKRTGRNKVVTFYEIKRSLE